MNAQTNPQTRQPGQFVQDSRGNFWQVVKATERTAHMNPANVTRDWDADTVTVEVIGEVAAKFINDQKADDRRTRIERSWASKDEFVAEFHQMVEFQQQAEARTTAELKAKEEEEIAESIPFLMDCRNTVERWVAEVSMGGETVQRRVFSIRYHAPCRGRDGIWLVSAEVDEGYLAFASKHVKLHNVSINAQHTSADSMSGRFMTSAHCYGESDEAVIAAVVRAVAR